MPVISRDAAIEAGDRLALIMATRFPRRRTHRQLVYNRNYIKWVYGWLHIAVENTGDALMVHGRVLVSTSVIYSRKNNYFTFFAATARTVGFDCEITTTEQLKDVRRELIKLFTIQIYRERESVLGMNIIP